MLVSDARPAPHRATPGTPHRINGPRATSHEPLLEFPCLHNVESTLPAPTARSPTDPKPPRAAPLPTPPTPPTASTPAAPSLATSPRRSSAPGARPTSSSPG